MAYDQLANALASSGASYTPRKRTHTDALIRSLMSGASSARGPWSALGNVLGLAIAKGGEGRLDEQEAAQRRATMEAQSEYLGGEWTPDALARAMAQPGIDPSALMAGAKDFQSMFPRQKPADRKIPQGRGRIQLLPRHGRARSPGSRTSAGPACSRQGIRVGTVAGVRRHTAGMGGCEARPGDGRERWDAGQESISWLPMGRRDPNRDGAHPRRPRGQVVRGPSQENRHRGIPSEMQSGFWKE